MEGHTPNSVKKAVEEMAKAMNLPPKDAAKEIGEVPQNEAEQLRAPRTRNPYKARKRVHKAQVLHRSDYWWNKEDYKD